MINEERGRDTALRFACNEGISEFRSLEGPLSYALAGEIERARLQALAEAIYRQITA